MSMSHWSASPASAPSPTATRFEPQLVPGPRLEIPAAAPLKLDCGVAFGPVTIAYQTYGTLNAARSNAILVCHALSGDQFVASRHPLTDKPGWWELMVGPGQNRSWKLPRAHPSFRLRSPQVTEPFIVAGVDASGAGSALRIKCLPEQFEVEPGPKNDAGAPIHFENPNSFTVQLAFESVDWSEDILTAAQVTNWQEFRDLFDAEVISPNEQITVGSQIILFTDLRGSTAMYNGIGDAPAYVVVRDHFTVLTDTIRDHHGAIVKTIGDAVMAVFSRVDEALSAVQQMHKGLQGALRTRGLPAPVMLKSSLHIGPCLAVNANDKLDYFGTTVNLAARLDGCCQGNDLTISDELYSRPETAQFLKEIGKSASPSEVKFRGFEKLHKVWRIPMV